MSAWFAQAQNIMKLGDVSVNAGQEATVNLSIDNASQFVAFQADIPIPTGLTYITSSAVLADTQKDGQSLSVSIINNNTLRLIGFSLSNTPFKGNSGTVVSFSLKAGTLPGNYILTLNNPIIGNSSSANILTSYVNGTVTILAPHIQLSVPALDFGRVPLGQSTDRMVTVSNTGTQSLQVTGIIFTDPQFSLIGETVFSLNPYNSKDVTVRFTAQTKGTYKNILTITSNDPARPNAVDTLNAVAFAVNELHTGTINVLSGQTRTLELTINNMEPFSAFQFDISLPSPMQYL
jgi:hypothetical protein